MSKQFSVLLALGFMAVNAHAEDYSLTDVQLFGTSQAKEDIFNGTGTSDKDLVVGRAEHYGTWKYGNNYIALDLYSGDDVGGDAAGSFGANTDHQTFFVFQPRVSLSKVSGTTLGNGFFKDVYLTYRREQASYANFHSDSYGVSVDLGIPGTVFFEQDFMARRTSVDSGTQWLSRTLWLAPFKVGSVGMHFDGLVLVKSTDNFDTNLLSQLDLLFDVPGSNSALQMGLRWETAKYDLPNGGSYSRNSPYFMLKMTF